VAIFPILLLALLAGSAGASFDERRLAAACGTCHPLDPIHAARLSRADWMREMDKMEAMGAKISKRNLLLDYLSAHYGLRKNAIPANRAR